MEYMSRTFRMIQKVLVTFLVLTGPVVGCGPGRRSGMMPRHRKMTPLVFKQHIPNLSEMTLAASGTAEGRITRKDPRFKELVRNENSDIVFKDEEGTGADRMMTQRCKDKLNTLAISVMNQWPGVKLRVTEAWDEDNHHARDSLHYEGRSVDITTSDRDRSKFGMLARLAVQAGFDWVYYESRAHIHCSVKSDSSIATKNGGCFQSDALAELEGGHTRRLSELCVGDRVLTVDNKGNLVYDEIMLFLHKDAEKEIAFITLETANGKDIMLTPNHLIHVSQSNATHITNTSPIFASRVKPSQYIYTANEHHTVQVDLVTSVATEVSRGVVAPLTTRGTIVVNNIIASCYAVLESENIAHAAFAPVRFWYSISDWLRFDIGDWSEFEQNVTLKTSSKDYHWYANVLYTLAPYILPDVWLIHL